jgi:hypothetical protein
MLWSRFKPSTKHLAGVLSDKTACLKPHYRTVRQALLYIRSEVARFCSKHTVTSKLAIPEIWLATIQLLYSVHVVTAYTFCTHIVTKVGTNFDDKQL